MTSQALGSKALRGRAAAPRRGVVLRHALAVQRRALIVWSAAFAALIGLYSAFWPSLHGSSQWRQLFETLPKSYRALFTVGGSIDLSTPAGYLGVELMAFMGPTLLAVYAIGTGAAAVAGEESQGTLEPVLAAPVARAAVLLERFGALVAGLLVLTAAQAAALLAFCAAVGMDLSAARIAEGGAALAIFGLFTGSVALAAGAATGRPAPARAVAALFAVAAYLVNALGQLTDTLRPVRPLSPFYLLLGNNPLANGLRIGPALAVIGVSLLIVALGAALLERRDLI